MDANLLIQIIQNEKIYFIRFAIVQLERIRLPNTKKLAYYIVEFNHKIPKRKESKPIARLSLKDPLIQ